MLGVDGGGGGTGGSSDMDVSCVHRAFIRLSSTVMIGCFML